MDIERLQRINQTLALLNEEQLKKTPLRPIQMLMISPSERLDEIASRHVGSLPLTIRTLLGGIGAMERRGAALVSYLLFESGYTGELIALGWNDAMNRKADVRAFFGLNGVTEVRVPAEAEALG